MTNIIVNITFVTINISDRLSFLESNQFLRTSPITFSFSYDVAVSICLYPASKAMFNASSNSFSCALNIIYFFILIHYFIKIIKYNFGSEHKISLNIRIKINN